jgi:hypothetical protein
MSLRNWIDRFPGVKRLLEPSEDVREGVSVEPPAMPPPCLYAGLWCGRDDPCGRRVCCVLVPSHDAPRERADHAEPGDTRRMPISEVSGTYERERGAPRGARRPTPMTACRAQHQAWHWENGNIWTYA